MKKLFIGTSGYNYKDWKGVFYPQNLPQKEWLIFYSKCFNTVEINATFYGNFKRHVFENWSSRVKDDFTFSIKGSRYITHVKRINNVEEEIENFFKNVQGLENKLSVILWQFGGNFKLTPENLERLENFVKLLNKKYNVIANEVKQSHSPDKIASSPSTSLRVPRNDGTKVSSIRHVFEFRDESWFKKEAFELLDKHKMGFVTNDSSVFPSIEKITGGFAYIRFHGPGALYSSSYSDKELKIWAEKIRGYLLKYDVYCYFNNDVNSFAVQNSKQLKELIFK